MIKQEDIDSRVIALLDYELDITINSGKIKTRNQLYDLVASQLGVHRVVVRRIAKKMVPTYVKKYNVLKNDKSYSCVGYKQF